MIFVTGGTGFLGHHLMPALCRAGYPVRVLTRQPEANRWLHRYPDVQVVHGDLSDRETLMQVLEGASALIHAGGYFRFWGDAQDFMRANAVGTENIMAAAVNAGVQRVVHISSVAVIGDPDPTHIIDESYPPHPVEPYQQSKLDGERIALRFYREHDLPVVVLRPGAFYGPLGQYGFNRLFFKDPMRGIIMQINGGRYINFPVYIEDVVQGVLLALDNATPGEVYNICGDWISHKDAFDIVCEEANLHYPRLRIPGWLGITTSRFLEILAKITQREPFWPLNLRSYVYNDWRVSNEKAQRDLGFVPTSFRDGVRRTVVWYRAGQPHDLDEFEC